MADGGSDGGSSSSFSTGSEWDGGLDIGIRQFIEDYTNGHLPQTAGTSFFFFFFFFLLLSSSFSYVPSYKK
jgi:hypothetical protein